MRAFPPRVVAPAVSLGAALLAWLLHLSGAFQPLERPLADAYVVAHGERDTLAPVVIVAVDYESLQRLGPWPWPRDIHARLVRTLTAAGASVIAFDILFLDGTDDDGPLAAAAAAAPSVVWASTFAGVSQRRFEVREHQGPTQALNVPSAMSGFVDLQFDPDGYVRRVTPVRPFADRIFRSFALTIAERYRHEPLLYVSGAGTRWRTANGPSVPTESDGSVLINFAAPPHSFTTVPYVKAVEGTLAPALFKDRIVLVGATAMTGELFFTPFYSRLFPETSRRMPGVEIHANVVDMFLRGAFITRAGAAATLAAFLLLGGVIALSSLRGVWLSLGVLLALVGACLAGGYAAFAYRAFWMPAAALAVSGPFIWAAVILYGFVTERAEKRRVRDALERYVSPALVREVIDEGVDLGLGGSRRPITVLFTDVRGFTGMSERIRPETLVDILCRHFSSASEIVHRHGGTLDKFIGDAVMAFWGAPTPRTDHALRAVKAALELQAATAELDAHVRAEIGESIRIGIGINTGDAVVGHIGSTQRMEYTAMGDPVNLASRVEHMTREHDADILITQFTYEMVKYEVDAEPLGSVAVRGRAEPILIYRVVGLKTGGG